MWPRSGAEVGQIVGAAVPEAAARRLYRGVVVGERAPLDDELQVALVHDGDDRHEAVLSFVAETGALSIVERGHPALSALDQRLRDMCIEVHSTLDAYRALASAVRRRLSLDVVAVIGSVGKTTTKDLLAAMLSTRPVARTPGSNNGWVGLPLTLLDRDLSATPPDALVLEVGIDEAGAMQAHAQLVDPRLVVVTALGDEHLRGLGDTARAVSEELVMARRPGCARIYPWADEHARALALDPRDGDIVVLDDGPPPARISCLRYRAEHRSLACTRLHYELLAPDGQSLAASFVDVRTTGRASARNTALAVAAALSLGRPPGELRQGALAFEPPPGRAHVELLPRGCALIDDSYNANPQSMLAAFELLTLAPLARRRRVLLLGDMLDLGPAEAPLHRALVAPLVALGPAHIVLFGAQMHSLAAPLAGALPDARVDALPAVDHDLPARLGDLRGAVVLVKASNGMQLWRAAELVRRHVGPSLFGEPPPPSPRLVVCGGPEREPIAIALKKALDPLLGPFTAAPPEALATLAGAAITTFGPDDPVAPLADVVVMTGLPTLEGRPAESVLAHLCAPLLAQPSPRVVLVNAAMPGADLVPELCAHAVMLSSIDASTSSLTAAFVEALGGHDGGEATDGL